MSKQSVFRSENTLEQRRELCQDYVQRSTLNSCRKADNYVCVVLEQSVQLKALVTSPGPRPYKMYSPADTASSRTRAAKCRTCCSKCARGWTSSRPSPSSCSARASS